MDCEGSSERMIDLLYGELAAAEEASVRAHFASCETCEASYARLSKGLDLASQLALVEAPRSALDAVLNAAVEKAAERAPATLSEAPAREATGPREDERAEPGGWAAILEWLGGLLMRPQLAMAMTLVLMVGIGLWYLPELRQDDPADAHAIVDPSAGDEAGPSAALAPAEPLELEADPRTGRIRPREAEDALASAREAAATRAAAADVRRPTTRVDDGEEDLAQERLAAADDLGEFGAMDLEPGESLAAAESMRTAQPSDAPSTAPAYALASSAQGAGAPRGVTPAAPAPPPAQEAQGTQRSEPAAAANTSAAATASADPRFDRGMERYRERDYRGAAVEFDSVVQRPSTDARQLLPQALHQLARSHRSAGQCREALPSYQRLLTQYSSYAGTPAALLEAADCHRRVGQLTQARTLLEQARRNASVSADADRELTRLAAAERAQDALDEAADEPAAASEPSF